MNKNWFNVKIIVLNSTT